MDESSKSKQAETREFWEEAIRLWSESGLSVREFCAREGLTEHTFYSHRRALQQEVPAADTIREPCGANDNEAVTGGRRRRRRKQTVGGNLPEATTQFIELVPPASAGVCFCTLELENKGGAKMRVKLRGFTATDVAAIGGSFWRVEP